MVYLAGVTLIIWEWSVDVDVEVFLLASRLIFCFV